MLVRWPIYYTLEAAGVLARPSLVFGACVMRDRSIRPSCPTLLAALAGASPLVSLFGGRPTAAEAKTFDIVGTVVCQAGSDGVCPPSRTLMLLTSDLSGSRAVVPIDVSWVLGQVAGLHPDDQFSLEVETAPDGQIRALRLWTTDQPAGKRVKEDNPSNRPPTIP
jgi:hypothetical protein